MRRRLLERLLRWAFADSLRMGDGHEWYEDGTCSCSCDLEAGR
jgi:hypothetical protein